MPTMDETRSALEAGATRQELLTAGYPGSSITKAAKQLAGAGDGRRRQSAVRTAKGLAPTRLAAPAALPAPSSELVDKREVLQLRQLDNALLVEGQKTERLQPETPKPPTEVDNARAVVGLLGDLKTLFPAPEPSSQTPAAGGSKLSSEQLLNLDIKRLELEERQLVREEERELLQVEKKGELVKEIGGYISKGLDGFLKVLSEVNQASAPAATMRQPVELNPSPSPGGWSAGGTWTPPEKPKSIEEDAMQPEEYGRDNVYRLVQSAPVGEGLTYVQRRNLGLLDQRASTSRPIIPSNPNPPDVRPPPPGAQKARFFTGAKTYIRGSA